MKKLQTFFAIILIFLLFGCTNNPKEDKSIQETSKTNNEVFNQKEENKEIENLVEEVTWEGEWVRNQHSEPGYLNIYNKTGNQFSFELEVSNGARTGSIEETATIEEKYAKFETNQGCKGIFTLKEEKITVETNESCSYYAGMGVVFEGTYEFGLTKITQPNLLELGIFKTETQHNEFEQLVGNSYEAFATSSQEIQQIEDLDNFNAIVYANGVPGLYTFMETIIMYNEEYIWAAYIDEDLFVRFFTNDNRFRKQLPKTIENWKSRFPDYAVIFINQ